MSSNTPGRSRPDARGDRLETDPDAVIAHSQVRGWQGLRDGAALAFFYLWKLAGFQAKSGIHIHRSSIQEWCRCSEKSTRRYINSLGDHEFIDDKTKKPRRGAGLITIRGQSAGWIDLDIHDPHEVAVQRGLRLLRTDPQLVFAEIMSDAELAAAEPESNTVPFGGGAGGGDGTSAGDGGTGDASAAEATAPPPGESGPQTDAQQQFLSDDGDNREPPPLMIKEISKESSLLTSLEVEEQRVQEGAKVIEKSLRLMAHGHGRSNEKIVWWMCLRASEAVLDPQCDIDQKKILELIKWIGSKLSNGCKNPVGKLFNGALRRTFHEYGRAWENQNKRNQLENDSLKREKPK